MSTEEKIRNNMIKATSNKPVIPEITYTIEMSELAARDLFILLGEHTYNSGLAIEIRNALCFAGLKE